MIAAIAFVIVAGCGGMLRAACSQALNKPRGFAYGTFVINVVGSFLLGVIYNLSPTLLTIVGTGLLGALTTYSGLIRDTVTLIELKRRQLALIYLSVSMILSVTAAYIGLTL